YSFFVHFLNSFLSGQRQRSLDVAALSDPFFFSIQSVHPFLRYFRISPVLFFTSSRYSSNYSSNSFLLKMYCFPFRNTGHARQSKKTFVIVGHAIHKYYSTCFVFNRYTVLSFLIFLIRSSTNSSI